MKYLSIVTTVLGIMISLSFQAQSQRPSAEERADFFMERIATKVELTDQQTEQIQALAIEFMIQHDSIRELYRGNPEQMHQAMSVLREQHSTQIRELLSEEQQEQFFANIPQPPLNVMRHHRPSSEKREAMHAFLSAERAEFENLLSEDEKAIIDEARAAVLTIHEKENHADYPYGFYNIRIFEEENAELFNKVVQIAENHKTELNAIRTKAFETIKKAPCPFKDSAGTGLGRHHRGMKHGKENGNNFGKGKAFGPHDGMGPGHAKHMDIRAVHFLLMEPSSESATASGLRLQVSPLPIAESATVTYSIATATTVSLTVTDANGNTALNLVHETQEAGTYTTTIESGSLNSGSVYFIQLATNSGHISKQIAVK